ncbi:MAG: hypothetical protein ACKOFH_15840, partial [Chthoniobacterales bacterium]
MCIRSNLTALAQALPMASAMAQSPATIVSTDADVAVWGTVTSGGPRSDCLRAVRAALAMLETV